MSSDSVADVGLGRASRALIPRGAFERIKEVVQSQQFLDGLKLFAIGAAVSASKSIADALLSAIKRVLMGSATFRGRDEAYRWILFFVTTHPAFRKSPRVVEVSARPSLLVDYQADSRGMISETEIRESWVGLESQPSDGVTKTRQGNEEKAGIGSIEQAGRATIGVHFFPAPGEQLHFVFQGCHFFASRERQLVGDSQFDETITVSFLSLTSNPLRQLIKHARLQYQEHARGRVAIHRLDRYSEWSNSSGIAKRSIDSIHLPGRLKEDVLEDAQKFISARQWYDERSIPWRRGFLFCGPPGSGKSSLCHVLASELEQPIYVLNLSALSMTDAEFLERVNEIPPRSIVLLEDIDAAFTQRDSDEDPKRKNVSFSSLLNAIDGVGAAEGRLLCMTTNYVERLDKALIRPGRIDRRFDFGNATQSQARKLFLRWHKPRDGRHDAGVYNSADSFAKNIPPNRVSVAALQGFLLTCGDDSQKAVRDVKGWIDEL